MGYTTKFHLDAYNGNTYITGKEWAKLVVLIKNSGLTEIKDILLKIYDEDGGEYKWYDWPSCIARLSAYFPALTFILSGQGEERDDTWIETWRNGQRLTCKMDDIMGKRFITWARRNHPQVYEQFMTEFTPTQKGEYDSPDFKIGRPLIPEAPSVNNSMAAMKI